MKYIVRWRQAAEDDLLNLWLDSSTDREDIARVALEIDRRLKIDAHLQGESREDRRRILFVEAYAVTFEVYQGEGIARVLAIWRAHS